MREISTSGSSYPKAYWFSRENVRFRKSARLSNFWQGSKLDGVGPAEVTLSAVEAFALNHRLGSLFVTLLLAGLFFVSVARGQAKSDPQSSVEPRSRPGAGQKFLEQFSGDWDVVKTFYSRSGEASRTTGTCRQRMIHDGRFL